MLLVSAAFVFVASLPDTLTYRISLPAGRAIGIARVPLVACALALTIGVAVSLFTGSV